MTALYNEIEPYAARWLDNLIAEGHIARGQVDRRSIVDLDASDIGSGQAHFFAGIGVWSLALRLAGVPDDVPVWTGSCPCQPFSDAGKGRGFDDERHLWPTWFGLIRECRPPLIFGEQVASADGLAWLDVVFADLERAGYTVGAFDLCAAGFGAPHIRQRLYFVAYTDAPGFGVEWRSRLSGHTHTPLGYDVDRRGETSVLADPETKRRGSGRVGGAHGRAAIESIGYGDDFGMADPTHARCEARSGYGHERCASGSGSGRGSATRSSGDGGMGDASSARGGRDAGSVSRSEGESASERLGTPSDDGRTRGFWRDAEWIPCRDPRLGVVYRPVEPGAFPLAHGATARVGRLRAYGNAIVAPLAALFVEEAIGAILETGT